MKYIQRNQEQKLKKNHKKDLTNKYCFLGKNINKINSTEARIIRKKRRKDFMAMLRMGGEK